MQGKLENVVLKKKMITLAGRGLAIRRVVRYGWPLEVGLSDLQA
jgi:hypothetical protein